MSPWLLQRALRRGQDWEQRLSFAAPWRRCSGKRRPEPQASSPVAGHQGLHCEAGQGSSFPPVASEMAGAYHWEARRRQMVMDRRLRLMQARGLSEGMQRMEVPKEPPPSQMAQKPPPPHDVKEDPCPCNTDHVLKHSGKLLKRYTTTEYIQQW